MNKLLSIVGISLFIILTAVAAPAPKVMTVMVSTNGELKSPTNFFTANSNLLNAAVSVTVTGSFSTNQAALNVTNLTVPDNLTLGSSVDGLKFYSTSRLLQWDDFTLTPTNMGGLYWGINDLNGDVHTSGRYYGLNTSLTNASGQTIAQEIAAGGSGGSTNLSALQVGSLDVTNSASFKELNIGSLTFTNMPAQSIYGTNIATGTLGTNLLTTQAYADLVGGGTGTQSTNLSALEVGSATVTNSLTVTGAGTNIIGPSVFTGSVTLGGVEKDAWPNGADADNVGITTTDSTGMFTMVNATQGYQPIMVQTNLQWDGYSLVVRAGLSVSGSTHGLNTSLTNAAGLTIAQEIAAGVGNPNAITNAMPGADLGELVAWRSYDAVVRATNGIGTALASITDASASKRYLLIVPAGTYTEEVTSVDWVDVTGQGTNSTFIESVSSAADTVKLDGHNTMWANMTIKHRTDLGETEKYPVHIDTFSAVPTTIILYNVFCIAEGTGRKSGVGIGMWENEKVYLIRSTFSGNAGIYAHNWQAQKAPVGLYVMDCKSSSTAATGWAGGYGMRFDNLGSGHQDEVCLLRTDFSAGGILYTNHAAYTGTNETTMYVSDCEYSRLLASDTNKVVLGVSRISPQIDFSAVRVGSPVSVTVPITTTSTNTADTVIATSRLTVGAPAGGYHGWDSSGKVNFYGPYELNRGTLTLFSSSAYGANKGGALALGGENGGGGTPCLFGIIKGAQESSGYAGYINFSTMDGSINMTERMRLTSDGRLGVGTNTPQALLHVRGSGIIESTLGVGCVNPGGAMELAASSAGGSASLFIHNRADSTLNNSADLNFGTWSGEKDSTPGAQIRVIETDAGSGGNAMVISTKDGAGTTAARLRIDADAANFSGRITGTSTISATNGFLFPQLSAIPTNSIPANSTTASATNWFRINLNGKLYDVATNFSAGGWLCIPAENANAITNNETRSVAIGSAGFTNGSLTLPGTLTAQAVKERRVVVVDGDSLTSNDSWLQYFTNMPWFASGSLVRMTNFAVGSDSVGFGHPDSYDTSEVYSSIVITNLVIASDGTATATTTNNLSTFNPKKMTVRSASVPGLRHYVSIDGATWDGAVSTFTFPTALAAQTITDARLIKGLVQKYAFARSMKPQAGEVGYYIVYMGLNDGGRVYQGGDLAGMWSGTYGGWGHAYSNVLYCAKRDGWKTVVLTLQHQTNYWTYPGRSDLSLMNNWLRNARVNETGEQLVDVLVDWNQILRNPFDLDLVSGDGLHLAPAGYRFMAGEIDKALRGDQARAYAQTPHPEMREWPLYQVQTPPNGFFTAPQGTLIVLKNDGAGAIPYLKRLGNGSNGWEQIPLGPATNVWSGSNAFTGPLIADSVTAAAMVVNAGGANTLVVSSAGVGIGKVNSGWGNGSLDLAGTLYGGGGCYLGPSSPIGHSGKSKWWSPVSRTMVWTDDNPGSIAAIDPTNTLFAITNGSGFFPTNLTVGKDVTVGGNFITTGAMFGNGEGITNLDGAVIQDGIAMQLLKLREATVTNLITIKQSGYAQSFPSATNALALDGNEYFISPATSGVSVTNTTGAEAGMTKWGVLHVLNTNATAMTFTFTAAGRPMGPGTTNSVSIPAGSCFVLSVSAPAGTILTNYATVLQR